jgi:hypothetical protein
VTTISCLEAVGTDLHESLELVNGVACEIGRVRGQMGDAVKSKLNTVLRRDDGYAKMCKISDIRSGNEAILGVDALPKGYHFGVVGGPSTPHDPESDAGGNLSSWQRHPSR